MTLTKPMLGLAVGGTLGLLDGLSGFFEPSLPPAMTSVITFSILKGLVFWLASFLSGSIPCPVGPFAGLVIATLLSFLVILKAGMGLFWGIMLPGMLLGLIVGFATRKFARRVQTSAAR